jgi:hypothetical protein
VDENPGTGSIWGGFKKYYAIPVSLLCLGAFVVLIFNMKSGPPIESIQTIRGQWNWNDSSLFEFQKITLRFESDSFFMMHRFIDPKKPDARLPCAQTDYQMYTAGRYLLEGNDGLRFDGNYTDSLYSRDSLRLCRDTGFKGRSQITWKGNSLCLGGEGFARTVCFTKTGSE